MAADPRASPGVRHARPYVDAFKDDLLGGGSRHLEMLIAYEQQMRGEYVTSRDARAIIEREGSAEQVEAARREEHQAGQGWQAALKLLREEVRMRAAMQARAHLRVVANE